MTIATGEGFGLLGPNGSGKSTALRLRAGLLAPTSGSVEVAGAEDRRRSIGFVFQEPTLMPWATVRDNVALPLRLSRPRRADIETRVEVALAKVGLAEFAAAYPRQLSGGMKMRASLARALVTDPDVLLMDEPFAALDALTRRKMQEELLQLWDDTRFTVLFVTHSIPEAVLLGNRILLLSPHPGQVKAELNSDGTDRTLSDGKVLSEHIQDMLFADAIEEESTHG